jgi:type IV pilus assembly protein PilW
MKHSRGLSLVELMVALAIGSLLIAGAVYVYSQSRNTQRVSETVARLQENGRYVLSVIEPEVQLGGYYGFSNSPGDIQYITGGSLENVWAAAKLGTDSTFTEAPGYTDPCLKNFALNVLSTIEGTNDNTAYPLSGKCGTDAAAAGGIRTGTDVLTVRRSSAAPVDGEGAPVDGRVQLLVNRLNPATMYMFADGQMPPGTVLKANFVQIRDLVLRSYYISNNSLLPTVNGLPSLRVTSLVDGPDFYSDTEVMRGVEDLQVQFGYDSGSYDGDGTIDAGFDEDNNDIPDSPNGIATRYDDPGSVPFGFQVVAVRLWVLIRADQPEQGFVDTRSYQMGSKLVPAPMDNFRRVLVSRTIQLRNARTL